MPKITLPVHDKDLANLRASGLTDATIRENGLRTEWNPVKLAEILKRRAGASCCKSGLVIPYRNIAGEVNCFARVRPHVPRVRDGQPIKYEQPFGESLRAYFPLASLGKLRDGKGPIYVTEGEKKALALSQLDLAAVGIGGIWCGCNKGTCELISDLADIPWAGRDVHIVFDYDEKPETRRNSDSARRRLAKPLRAAHANEVYNVELPPGPNGAKQGVDDFLVANGATAFHQLVKEAQPVGDATGSQAIKKAEGRTDTANAARLVGKYRDVIRWVGSWNKWLTWDGRRWKIDQNLCIEAYAKQIADRLWKELAAELAQGGVNETTMKAMFGFAKASNSVNGISAMVALARSEPGIPISVEELDTQPWLLNVENGTLDLRTGQLQEHRQEDFITKLAPVTFDPAATCPRWLAFLNKIFAGNGELGGYMQRLVGYCLAGATEEHILPFLYGTGANGKSTLCELILKLMGPDYSMKAAPDLLMAKRGESHPTDRADLFGKRFVACVETEEGRRMAEALVKELTGGDRVRARRMREDFWEFTPTHHVWLAGNHKPTIIGTDHGIWRRIKLIPFDVVIPDGEQDKKLPAKLGGELGGILNWAIAGCLEWQKGGMREPTIVQAATTGYAAEMDEIGQFITERCEQGPGLMAPATELYEAFQHETPGSRITQHIFGARLRQRGFEKGRTNTGRHGWKGLRLLKDAANAKTTAEFLAAMNARKQKK